MSTSLNGAPSQPCAPQIPAAIAGSVDLLVLADALARAGLVGRRDRERKVFVIEPAGAERYPQIDPEAVTAAVTTFNRLSLFEERDQGRLRLVVDNDRVGDDD
jgi:hypothetical protein